MEAASAALMKKYRVSKLNIGRLKDQMSDISQIPTMSIEGVSKLEALLFDFRKQKDVFENIVESILMELDDTAADYAKLVAKYEKDLRSASDISATYEGKIKMFHKLLSMQERRESLAPSGDVNQSFGPSVDPNSKLDKISVPEFDGNIVEFPNWRGMFEHLVHNTDMPNVRKLYYLKLKLVGEAGKIIRDVKLDSESYVGAWQAILNRFDNKRSLIRDLFSKLESLRVIKNRSEIRQLVDDTDSVIQGLVAAGEQINDTCSRMIAFKILSLLDQKSRDDFEDSYENRRSYPKWVDLQKFLQNRADTFEAKSSSKEAPSSSAGGNKQKFTEKKSFSTTVKQQIKCVVCSKSHFLNQCDKFAAKNQAGRFEVVKRNKLCIKCFNPFHGVNNCTRPDCSACGGKHNRMLHREESPKEVPSNSSNNAAEKSAFLPNSESVSRATMATSVSISADKVVVLPTAVVYCGQQTKTGFEKIVYARTLLDQGSQSNLVSEDFVKKHRLSTFRTQPVSIGGITGNVETSNWSTTFTVRSRYNSFQMDVTAEVVRKIPFTINYKAIVNIIRGNVDIGCFAEKAIGHDCVDLLIGAEFYETIVNNERKEFDGIFLRDSHLGWLISGPYVFRKPEDNSFCGLTTIDVQDQLKQFWQIEEVGVQPDIVDKNELQHCVEFVERTLTRNSDGQFIAKLPFKRSPLELGDSYHRAKKQMQKFATRYDEKTQQLYRNFIQEYIDLEHMSKINENPDYDVKRYFMPHRAVLRPDSSTTECRVVFNASAPTTNGLSLNNLLMVGPVIQPDLLEILWRFRTYATAFSADITKMYRKILVDVNDRPFQSILWDVDGKIERFQLNTLTYGTSPASYIATHCLAVLGNEFLTDSPESARAIKYDFYMDDLLTGAGTIQEAMQLQQVIHKKLREAHFLLRKYASNSPELLANISPELIERAEKRSFGPKGVISLLGLQWKSTTDEFKFKLQLRSDNSFIPNLTKRILLSEISRIFDPMGILSPVTVRAKLILSEVWVENKQWDDLTSEYIRELFAEYYNDLQILTDLSFRRRYTLFEKPVTSQLVGFCDASEKAYCAVVYLRTVNEEGQVDSYIVAAKTKIAPKGSFKITIPKLELQAAELLSRLTEKIADSLTISKTETVAFSDSEVVLAWVKGDINRWTPFVQNRVQKITKIISKEKWGYCSTKLNPADLATRGIFTRKLIANKLWFHGPEFLRDAGAVSNDSTLRVDMKNLSSGDIPEQRKTVHLVKCEEGERCRHYMIVKFSNFNRLVRVFGYVLRFVKIVRDRKIKAIRFAIHQRVTRSKEIISFSSENVALNSFEYSASLRAIIRYVQRVHYTKEIALLSSNQRLTKNSSLFNVDPFIDCDGIVRSKSRLQNADLSFETKNLIILPAKCEFLESFISHIHTHYFHATVSFIVNFVRSSYHIHGGLQNVVKKKVRDCVVCRRFSVRATGQKIGQLPFCRVNVSRPFSNVGVDLAGPFATKCIAHRTTKVIKSYIAIFICTVTKAVHIETLYSLTTASFMSVLNRFVSRRGVPVKLLSDNAKNFIGARNFLVASQSKQLDWKFIPPRAPHQGGLWESGVKAAKRHFTRAVKGNLLSHEEFETIFIQIEAILNSRPLCKQGYNVITPGHFLVGSNLLVPSVVPAGEENLSLGKRYLLQQSIIQSFWRIWRKDYLNELRLCYKWRTSQPNVQVGDVVVLIDDLAPPANWKLGRIEAVHPASDGLVRVVSVRSNNYIFKRDIRKLIPLVEGNPSTGGSMFV